MCVLLVVVVSKHCTVQVQNQLDEPPFAQLQLLLAAHKFVATRTQHAAIVGWVAGSRLPFGLALSLSRTLCLSLSSVSVRNSMWIFSRMSRGYARVSFAHLATRPLAYGKGEP